MASVRVKIWPNVQDVHDGVSRYTIELMRAIGLCTGVRLVDEGEDILHLVAAHRYMPGWREVKASGRKLVVTVHDLIPEHEGFTGPQYSGVAERKVVLDAANSIVAVSQWTKDDVVRTYGIAPEKIVVIHNGVSPLIAFGGSRASAVARDARPYQLRDVRLRDVRPYLLWVGRRAGYKNFFWFARAVAPFLWTHQDIHVICTGGQAFGRKERIALTLLGLVRRFEVRGVNDAELRDLYAEAYAFVMPSRSEGFGIPVIEAMSAGCPVVLPCAHVFPEVASDAALWYRLDHARELRNCLRRLNDTTLRTALAQKGQLQAKNFSWALCAEKLNQVYEELFR